ncbi:MAG TPA: PAS domain S-box protein [Chthoniobacteraceae bacterium]|jgi:PAS domain S-box-containing protein|nr:PAS domain S-box protein [Chthoniobacteraceae bacterium]
MNYEGDAARKSVSERVLVLAPVGRDAAAIASVLDEAGHETRICANPTDCAACVQETVGALIMTEEALELPNASCMLDALKNQPPWSELPVTIFTSGGESRLGSLLDLAATAARSTTLLERPVGKATLLRSAQVALNFRRRQYQLRQLLEAQAHLAAIVTSSDDAIISKTLQGIVTSWNCGAERIFGYTAEEMVGQSILKLIPKEFSDEEDRILSRLKNGQRIDHYETIRVRKDGTRVPVSLTVSPMRDGSGRLLGASKIARDITERRLAEENLRLAKEAAEAASRAKDSFLAALSHELRTPLTPVLITTAALREDERLPDDVKTQLSMMERNVLLEARLIDDLLDLTRITHGKLAVRSETCDAHSILGLVVEIVQEEVREKAIVITLDLAAKNHFLSGDPARLQQVFWNLLRNAVKFAPKSGHIRIETKDRPENRMCVAIRDDGIGFDAELAARIFEPFEQGADPRITHRGGLGLGLAIAHALVEMHCGSIRAESPGPGKGATFTVELPCAAVPEGAAFGTDGAHFGLKGRKGCSDRKMRLLVVEDHAPTSQVLGNLLIRDGHSVISAASLADARAAAAANHFDAVISDLGLPDGTGMELMKELHQRYGLHGIALSGYGMEEDLRRSREAGFTAHLVKPVDVNELRATVRQLAASLPDEDGSTAPEVTLAHL